MTKTRKTTPIVVLLVLGTFVLVVLPFLLWSGGREQLDAKDKDMT